MQFCLIVKKLSFQAGTLRYLSPEALEGALDLSGARAALCAVDVFALGLVLWEMLWRCSGAHATPTANATPLDVIGQLGYTTQQNAVTNQNGPYVATQNAGIGQNGAYATPHSVVIGTNGPCVMSQSAVIGQNGPYTMSQGAVISSSERYTTPRSGVGGAKECYVPPYAPPYHHHGLPPRPTLAQMQVGVVYFIVSIDL